MMLYEYRYSFFLFCTMTNKCGQLSHKLSHCYMFRHYRVIIRELVLNTLPSYTSISNAAVGNTIHPICRLTTYIYIYIHTHTHIQYICRTAQLTSRRCILNIYSTNVRCEYFKHAAQSPFFSLQNAVYFIMLPCLVPVLFTF
jgi:hypothetical protein